MIPCMELYCSLTAMSSEECDSLLPGIAIVPTWRLQITQSTELSPPSFYRQKHPLLHSFLSLLSQQPLSFIIILTPLLPFPLFLHLSISPLHTSPLFLSTPPPHPSLPSQVLDTTSVFSPACVASPTRRTSSTTHPLKVSQCLSVRQTDLDPVHTARTLPC